MLWWTPPGLHTPLRLLLALVILLLVILVLVLLVLVLLVLLVLALLLVLVILVDRKYGADATESVPLSHCVFAPLLSIIVRTLGCLAPAISDQSCTTDWRISAVCATALLSEVV